MGTLTLEHFIHLLVYVFIHTIKCVYNGHPWEMTRWLLHTGGPLYTGQICKKYKATENFGKLFGDY